mgnify:CR=1 FL=1
MVIALVVIVLGLIVIGAAAYYVSWLYARAELAEDAADGYLDAHGGG